MLMRRNNLLLLFLLSCMGFSGFSQLKTHDSAFEKGIILFDLHSSIGLYKDRNFLTTRMPLFIGADYGLSEKLSLGVFVGWNQRTFKKPFSPQFDVNFYYYCARFSVHTTEWLGEHTILKFNPQRIDTYVNVWAGQQHSSVINFNSNSPTANKTILGVLIGARIYTMRNVGVLVEIGPGAYGLINIGLCGKL